MNVLAAISLLVLQTPLIGSGKEGALTVRDAGVTLNRYALLLVDAPAMSKSIDVSDGTVFRSNQLILLHQTQLSVARTGAADGGTLVSDELGRTEVMVIKAVEGNRILLAKPLTQTFYADGSQVVTVPEYGNVLVTSTGTLTASSWSADAGGGILAFLTRSLTIEDGGVLSAAGRGFPGGAADQDPSLRPPVVPCAGGGTFDLGPISLFLSSRAGTGANTGHEGARGLSHGWMGASGHVVPSPPILQTCYPDGGLRSKLAFEDLGGAGGGHLGRGGRVGAFEDVPELPQDVLAVGGFRSRGGEPTTHLHPLFGGGAAAGTGDLGRTPTPQRPGRGGNGGGIVLIRAGSLSGGGIVTAQGETGEIGVSDGPGGGGAGGTVDVLTTQVGTCPMFDARGGTGGSNTTSFPHAPGAGGGGGLVLFSGSAGACAALIDGGVSGQANLTNTAWIVIAGDPGHIERSPTTLADVQLTVDYPMEGKSYLAETMCISGAAEPGAIVQGEIDGEQLEPTWVEEKRFVLCGGRLKAGRHDARVWARGNEGIRLSPTVNTAFITTPPHFSCEASWGWAAPWLVLLLTTRRRK